MFWRGLATKNTKIHQKHECVGDLHGCAVWTVWLGYVRRDQLIIDRLPSLQLRSMAGEMVDRGLCSGG